MLYVADTNNHRVQKLTSSGKFLHKFGQHGSGQGQFNFPIAVIIDSRNKLIVSDCSNHRIQIFNENGGWLLTIDGKGSGNHSFSLHGVLPWTLRETFMLQSMVQTLSKCLPKKVPMSGCMVIFMLQWNSH